MTMLATAAQTVVGLPDMPLVTGAVLLGGCLGVLFANVMTATGQKSRGVPMKHG